MTHDSGTKLTEVQFDPLGRVDILQGEVLGHGSLDSAEQLSWGGLRVMDDPFFV